MSIEHLKSARLALLRPPWICLTDEQIIIDLQGCHEFSSELYQSLRTRVASEHFYFWLNSLKEFSQAEQCLSHVADGDYSGAMSAIAEALRSYQKGIASLTVSTLPGICLSKDMNVISPPTSPALVA